MIGKVRGMIEREREGNERQRKVKGMKDKEGKLKVKHGGDEEKIREGKGK